MKPSEIVRGIAYELRIALREQRPLTVGDLADWAFLLKDIAPEIEAMETRTGPIPTVVADYGDNIVVFRPRSSLSHFSETGEGSA